MFELQIMESHDHEWSTVWKSRSDDEPENAILRLMVVQENLEKMGVFEPDTRYRIVSVHEKF